MKKPKPLFLPHDHFQSLLDILHEAGYACHGPQVRDGAIMYDLLTHSEQLPWGMRAHQAPGQYRIEPLDKHLAFSWANGPQAIKPILFKPRETVWRVARNADGKLEFKPHQATEPPVALIGARACDLAAMLIQDKVFANDALYQDRRQSLFIVGVNCTWSSDNCFCVSAGTGPSISQPCDLLMTELDNGFVIRSNSERGQVILDRLHLQQASMTQCDDAEQSIDEAAAMQTKRIPLDNKRELRDLLFANLNHPRWDDVAERCLSCGNCTSVCPTCFCHSQADKPDLDGSGSVHEREWDSCFTAGHSEVAGRPVRDDTRLRYRQWLTHKVGSWFDQFDSSGCTGCGRCISWCPVGIDLTEELAAITGESCVRGKKS